MFSILYGWSGICTGTGNCAFTMNNDTSVTATFNKDVAHSVRIDDATTTYYSSISAACYYAVSGDIIKVWGTDFTENPWLYNGTAVTIRGGFNSTYATNSGYTTLHGTLTIAAGSAVIDQLVIQ
jgi:hypothetical protein